MSSTIKEEEIEKKSAEKTKLGKGKIVFIITSIILGLVIAPFLINLLIVSEQNLIAVSKDSDWIGFFGSYSGSIIGGTIGAIIAVFIAKLQVKQQKDNFEKELNFRIESQEREFNSQMELMKDQENEKNKKAFRKTKRDQIVYLVDLELEAIKMKNNSYRLYENYLEYIKGTKNYAIAARQPKATDQVWTKLNILIDLELQFRLKQLYKQYNECIEIVGMNIFEIEIDLNYKNLEYNELKLKGEMSPKERLDLRRIEIEKNYLEGEYSYYLEEKKYFWELINKKMFYHLAENCRDLIRKEIISSCELNELEIPIDPNNFA